MVMCQELYLFQIKNIMLIYLWVSGGGPEGVIAAAALKIVEL